MFHVKHFSQLYNKGVKNMIEPNSKLRLHAYIPLDVEHVNTILFPSVSAQNKYFENAEHTFTKLQYSY